MTEAGAVDDANTSMDVDSGLVDDEQCVKRAERLYAAGGVTAAMAALFKAAGDIDQQTRACLLMLFVLRWCRGEAAVFAAAQTLPALFDALIDHPLCSKNTDEDGSAQRAAMAAVTALGEARPSSPGQRSKGRKKTMGAAKSSKAANDIANQLSRHFKLQRSAFALLDASGHLIVALTTAILREGASGGPLHRSAMLAAASPLLAVVEDVLTSVRFSNAIHTPLLHRQLCAPMRIAVSRD